MRWPAESEKALCGIEQHFTPQPHACAGQQKVSRLLCRCRATHVQVLREQRQQPGSFADMFGQDEAVQQNTERSGHVSVLATARGVNLDLFGGTTARTLGTCELGDDISLQPSQQQLLIEQGPAPTVLAPAAKPR